MNTHAPRRPGRPLKGEDALLDRINIRVPREMMMVIERIANERLDKPDRAAVIRELLAEAIEAREARRKQ